MWTDRLDLCVFRFCISTLEIQRQVVWQRFESFNKAHDMLCNTHLSSRWWLVLFIYENLFLPNLWTYDSIIALEKAQRRQMEGWLTTLTVTVPKMGHLVKQGTKSRMVGLRGESMQPLVTAPPASALKSRFCACRCKQKIHREPFSPPIAGDRDGHGCLFWIMISLFFPQWLQRK